MENPYASGQKKRPRGPRALGTTKRIEPATEVHLSTPPTAFDIPKVAVVYFVRCHIQGVDERPSLLKHALDDLLPTLSSSGDVQIVDLAMSTLAMALFSRTHGLPHAEVQAFGKYQQLLQLLRMTLPNLNPGNVEACLLSVLLMCLYEDAIHRPAPNGSTVWAVQSSSHIDGTIALLKFWKDHSAGKPASNLIKHARRAALKWAMIRNVEAPDWLQDGAAFGEEGFELDYDRILIRLLKTRNALTSLIVKSVGIQPPSKEIDVLNKEAKDIDKALKDWTRNFPRRWCYRRHTIPEDYIVPKEHFYSREVYSYHSPAYAAVWLKYFQNRLLVNSTRLRILQLRGDSDTNCDIQAQQSECLALIKAMTDELTAAVPFCLDKWKVEESSEEPVPKIKLNLKEDLQPNLAGLAIGALTVVACLRHTPTDQKTWLKSQLLHIGTACGYGLFESVVKDNWMQL